MFVSKQNDRQGKCRFRTTFSKSVAAVAKASAPLPADCECERGEGARAAADSRTANALWPLFDRLVNRPTTPPERRLPPLPSQTPLRPPLISTFRSTSLRVGCRAKITCRGARNTATAGCGVKLQQGERAATSS